MKIQGEVLSVLTMGDKLAVELEMQTLPAADWRPWLKVSLQMECTARSRKVYHVGRIVELTVNPK